jgi:hypothetical protein
MSEEQQEPSIEDCIEAVKQRHDAHLTRLLEASAKAAPDKQRVLIRSIARSKKLLAFFLNVVKYLPEDIFYIEPIIIKTRKNACTRGQHKRFSDTLRKIFLKHAAVKYQATFKELGLNKAHIDHMKEKGTNPKSRETEHHYNISVEHIKPIFMFPKLYNNVDNLQIVPAYLNSFFDEFIDSQAVHEEEGSKLIDGAPVLMLHLQDSSHVPDLRDKFKQYKFEAIPQRELGYHKENAINALFNYDIY